MNEAEKKEEFKKILKEGQPKWKYFPYNFQEGQPCPMGCIIKQRIAPPHEYSLSGDCRAPYSDECCMNIQDKERELQRELKAQDAFAGGK